MATLMPPSTAIQTSKPTPHGPPQPPLMRIFREPLLHFVVLGALLFGLYFWVHGPEGEVRSHPQINVTAATIASLQTTWRGQWGGSPTPAELQTLVDDYIHDEVLYQEALALGLDDKDVIVRQRLIQKMQLLTQDTLAIPEPSDEQLQTYLAEHASRYTIPGHYSFTHLYFSQQHRRDRTDADAQARLQQLQAAPDLNPWQHSPPWGDRSMLPTTYTRASGQMLANTLGGTFAREMAAVTETGWQGPFHSAYGSHLVHISAIEPGHPATLDQARDQVRSDWLQEQQRSQNQLVFQKLRDRYTISIDPAALNAGAQEAQS